MIHHHTRTARHHALCILKTPNERPLNIQTIRDCIFSIIQPAKSIILFLCQSGPLQGPVDDHGLNVVEDLFNLILIRCVGRMHKQRPRRVLVRGIQHRLNMLQTRMRIVVGAVVSTEFLAYSVYMSTQYFF